MIKVWHAWKRTPGRGLILAIAACCGGIVGGCVWSVLHAAS